jgi:hypothetical protein
MRFPQTFTKENKITFYTQRKREMEKRFIKSMNESKEELSNKINEEIKICEKELLNLNK